MKIAKLITILGMLAQGGIIIYGFTVGDFAGEGSQLLQMPWGIVSLVDLYVCFALFSAWVVFREKSAWRSAVWVVLMMILGAFTASLYAFLALQSSGGNWVKFWMGDRAPESSY